MKTRLILFVLIALVFQGCQYARTVPCRPIGTNLTGQWRVTFANQDPPVVWQISQCETDLRGSEERGQDNIALQGTIQGMGIQLTRTPRSATDPLKYQGQLAEDGRIQGTFTGAKAQTSFTAVRVQ